jgi:hypothetical protein
VKLVYGTNEGTQGSNCTRGKGGTLRWRGKRPAEEVGLSGRIILKLILSRILLESSGSGCGRGTL